MAGKRRILSVLKQDTVIAGIRTGKANAPPGAAIDIKKLVLMFAIGKF